MTEIKTTPSVIDLDRPYLGWLDHYAKGWQAAIVRLKDGRRAAYRLGDELSFERVTEMCRVLSETTSVPVAGELSKRGFLPVADTTEATDTTEEVGVASADLEDALGVLHWLLTDRQDVLHVAAMAAAQGDAMRSAVIANAARGWIEACARLAEVCDSERGDHG